MERYDWLIAGSGLAGLYAAYRASQYGRVAVVTKSTIRESNTYYAQGGIAAVTLREDKPQFHFNDTIVAGRELCNPMAVNLLVNEVPHRIEELVAQGMEFDSEDGKLLLGLEGGHHKRRVLHAGGDSTGRRLIQFLIEKIVNNRNITLFENHRTLSIIYQNNECSGLTVWDIKNNKERAFRSHHTILALGGASALYESSTNPQSTIGEGVAICYEAGIPIVDMEFIQFHPTAVKINDHKSYLISEAVRGEGAYLINGSGERFMLKIDPLAELAPRDVVARAVFNEGEAYLSIAHLNIDRLEERFPNIFKACRELGIDVSDRIPVSPAAHYMVGGVKTDLYGQTTIKNLYACGELASTGIMGANRLASNSLAECLVFGYRAVEKSLEATGNDKSRELIETRSKRFYNDTKNSALPQQIKESISHILTNYAGLIRNREGLLVGLKELERLKEQLPVSGAKGYLAHIDNVGFGELEGVNLHSCKQLIRVAQLIVEGALCREESRGAHFREEFPVERGSSPYHTVQQKGEKIETKSIL